jgi:hypothetical protein
MKTIIIPDLHNRVEIVEPALSSPVLQPYNNVVFLGDYFDNFYDTPQDAANSARWLKQSLHKPNRIHLLGTHDMWYRFPDNPFVIASGNTEQKANVISHILNEKDWDLIISYYYEQNFLMTHAGVHSYLIEQYVLKNKQIFDKYIESNNLSLSTQEIIEMIIKPATEEALKDVKNNVMNNWFEAGFARWGTQKVGGITWLDWFKEFQPIPGLNQIVGHSELKIPQSKNTQNSKNYCLDTRSRHIGILENGEFTYVETIDVLEATNGEY